MKKFSFPLMTIFCIRREVFLICSHGKLYWARMKIYVRVINWAVLFGWNISPMSIMGIRITTSILSLPYVHKMRSSNKQHKLTKLSSVTTLKNCIKYWSWSEDKSFHWPSSYMSSNYCFPCDLTSFMLK